MGLEESNKSSVAAKPTLKDYLQLWVLKLAKLRRGRLEAAQGENYDQFYEEFFEQKDIEAYERDRRMTVRRETINHALEQLAPPPKDVLDVGCGLGDVLAGLNPGYRLHGMEYAHSCVKSASRRLEGRAEIKHGSIYEIPYPAMSMDVCICLEVLEHIEDDARAVRDIARVLRPGGILIAAVPYTYYWPQYQRLMGHFRHYTRESFSQLIDQNGLSTESYLPNYPNFHQGYTRRYAMIRGQAMTFGRILGCSTLYNFKWPGARRPSLESLGDRLEPLRQRDAALDYSRLSTSTFLVARKK